MYDKLSLMLNPVIPRHPLRMYIFGWSSQSCARVYFCERACLSGDIWSGPDRERAGKLTHRKLSVANTPEKLNVMGCNSNYKTSDSKWNQKLYVGGSMDWIPLRMLVFLEHLAVLISKECWGIRETVVSHFPSKIWCDLIFPIGWDLES